MVAGWCFICVSGTWLLETKTGEIDAKKGHDGHKARNDGRHALSWTTVSTEGRRNGKSRK